MTYAETPIKYFLPDTIFIIFRVKKYFFKYFFLSGFDRFELNSWTLEIFLQIHYKLMQFLSEKFNFHVIYLIQNWLINFTSDIFKKVIFTLKKQKFKIIILKETLPSELKKISSKIILIISI